MMGSMILPVGRSSPLSVNRHILHCGHRLIAININQERGTLAYNLGTFLRRLAVPRSVKHWSLTTLREKLIKIGAKVVTHARYVTFQMGNVGQ